MSTHARQRAPVRVRLLVNGVVQGVGFRPYVYRLATEEKLSGSVSNGPHGVTIELEGHPDALENFQGRLRRELPAHASISSLDIQSLPLTGEIGFEIAASGRGGSASTLIPPDLATCDDCIRELFDPGDRRYCYPFINCTNCGPRYTIVQSIPYDRPYTSMTAFTLCPQCRQEYDDPSNRRFHAQPNACPDCGPKLRLCDAHGTSIPGDPVATTIQLLKAGKIIALRGVGGFHLAVDATNESAVRHLRQRKGRAEKPFALMAPHIDTVESYCWVTESERALLMSPTRPIVLLRKKETAALAPSVAPLQQYLGFMLPYTPVHHLVMRGSCDALVMTSGNLSEEPIAISNEEALSRLRGIADYLLLHDREILQRCDDSIVRVQLHRPRIIRRSRGYVPLPVTVRSKTIAPILAVGGELKNTLALSRDQEVFLSQHIGDLDNPAALGFFEECVNHLQKILEVSPQAIACDLHPDYLSSQWAHRQALTVIPVQHHHAHLAAVLAENEFGGQALGIILDGTGYGTDRTIWGGELLFGDASAFERLAWLAPVAMPGGPLAIKQPWRMAISYLYNAYGKDILDLPLALIERHRADLPILLQMIDQGINAPLTSSCGRLFDAVAGLLGFDQDVAYEAQAAIQLEMFCTLDDIGRSEHSAPAFKPDGGPICTKELIMRVTQAIMQGVEPRRIAADFHKALAEIWLNAASRQRELTGCTTVALSGGVFQNSLMFEVVVKGLVDRGFTVLTHHQVPTNDGGIPLGQVVVADAYLRRQRS